MIEIRMAFKQAITLGIASLPYFFGDDPQLVFLIGLPVVIFSFPNIIFTFPNILTRQVSR